MTNQKPTITERQLDTLKSRIQDELTKRAIFAQIIEMGVEETRGRSQIEFKTETFNTVPVLFKTIYVGNFNSSITTETVKDRDDNDRIIHRIWITVNVRYTHFDGGSNGSHLFTVNANAFDYPNGDSYMTDIIIS